MTATLAEQIIARAAGRDRVAPGEIVTCRVDLAMMHDSGGPRRIAPILEDLGCTVWDRDKVVVVTDHFVPAVDAESAAIGKLTRDWVAGAGIKRFHDMEGICHVVLPEYGLLRPGMFVAGGDSHSTTGGAFGCFMFGVGATDMAAILATGETWIRVPGTMRIEWSGRVGSGVCAKDMMLLACGRLGMGAARNRVVEFTGPAVRTLAMDERMTLCNMAAELGAMSGMIAADEITAQALRDAGVAADEIRAGDDGSGARPAPDVSFDAGDLVPQVAAPHSPANAGDVAGHAGTAVNQAYIGACTGAKLDDLRMAARVLEGRRVAPGVRLLVAPASTRITAAAAADGILAILSEAGAKLLPSGCGACAGFGAGVLADGETCIATTARNFKGRMGAPGSRVYLASPYTVAASAVAGVIADPRPMLEGAADA